jgi:putative hydrolase of the HAD superfamily
VLGSEQVGILGVWKRDSFWGDFEHSRVVDDLLEVLSFLEVEKKTRR